MFSECWRVETRVVTCKCSDQWHSAMLPASRDNSLNDLSKSNSQHIHNVLHVMWYEINLKEI